MSVEQIVLVCAGFSANALTFVLGVMVGLALTTRKESKNDNSNSNEGTKKDPAHWHSVERR
jgi:hypothetical protein